MYIAALISAGHHTNLLCWSNDDRTEYDVCDIE